MFGVLVGISVDIGGFLNEMGILADGALDVGRIPKIES